MASLPLEEVLRGCPKVQQQQEKVRPQPEQPLKCPRCESTNTKFCYYNNYSLSQPRYFCKGCRRYWTKGGTLRNVPVGGGCRKNKKSSSSSSSKRPQDQAFHTHSKTPPLSAATIIPPLLAYDPNELASAFARLQEPHHNQGHLLEDHETFLLGNPNHKPAGFLDGTTDHSDFHNLFCGYGGNSNVYEDRVLPFDGGLSGEETAAATSVSTSQVSGKTLDGEEGKTLVGVQWQDGEDFNISLDSYCNGGVQLGIDSSTAPLCNR